jgi:16S rRNA (cytosine1402-N4)-methyltransferase
MRYLVNIEDYALSDICYIYEKAKTLKYFTQMNYENHIPVLLNETIELLSPKDGETYIDCTFGAGGHTRAILEKANCRVISIDRDPNVKIFAKELEKEFGERFTFIEDRFSNLDNILNRLDINYVDGILMDIGFSSMQVDTPRRGFSFMHEGPLDMRMESDGISAEDVVNEATFDELSDIIFRFGDERKSREIARAIIKAREIERIISTKQLSEIVKKAVGKYNDEIHPATRTFQAIRIFVNEEFEELKSCLQKAKDKLKENGRLVVITFHSGEDVIVKNFFKNFSTSGNQGFSRYSPSSVLPTNSIFNELEILTSKPIAASAEEIENNIRARSAKVRAVKKLSFAN